MISSRQVVGSVTALDSCVKYRNGTSFAHHLPRSSNARLCGCNNKRQTFTANNHKKRGLAVVAESAAAPPAAIQSFPEDSEFDVELPKSGSLALTGRLLQVGSAALQFVTVLAASKGLNSRVPAKQIQNLLTKLGPAFVKLAQTLSMRPDLIGQEYADALTELQDNVAAFPNEEAFAILEEELGRPPSEIFAYISAQPVASASLGQVYRGILRPELGSHPVAIKVQRPGVLKSITVDIQLLRYFIGVVQKAARITRDLRGLADEVGKGLIGECDFRREAANAQEFIKAHKYMDFIMVPRVFNELTTRRLLVSEWVEGRSPTQLFGDESRSAKRALLDMVQMGIQCSLAQLLVTGVLHGDPHSGNLLLSADGKLCYLDFGLIVKVSPQHRQAMMAALVHLGLGNWKRLVDDLDQMELLKPETDKVALASDLEKEFGQVLSQGAEPGSLQSQLPLLSLQNSQLSFSTLTAVLFKVAYKYRFLLPAYFPLVVRSVSSLEGIALSIDPNFKLISAGMPVVLTQLLSDRRPAAKALLEELLLSPGGALRTDETSQQILQVWLNAAQQAADADAATTEEATVEEKTTTKIGTSEAAVNLTSLLLDGKHVPLRRTLMTVNPAATVTSMSDDMRNQMVKLLTEALSGAETVQAAASLLNSSPTARAQRKRLRMLFTASVPKVLSSSPLQMWQLLTFTAAVVFGVFTAHVKRVFTQLFSWLFGGFIRNNRNNTDVNPSLQS